MKTNKLVYSFICASIASTCIFGSIAAAAENSKEIHVDQVGYLTEYPKTAVVTDSGQTSFSVVNTKTGKVVYTGNLSSSVYDKSSGENVQQADFSTVKAPGTYKVVVGDDASYPFKINDNVYEVPMIHSWRAYTLSRSNIAFNDPVTGLKLDAQYPDDRHAKLYFTDKLNKKDTAFDMSGGWYDAGDYGKYITTAGISTSELMLAYEANPAHFTKGQLFFPNGIDNSTNMPDALAEIKYELDWMLKMQRSDGSVFHKVAGMKWPDFSVAPDKDTQPRFIFSTSTYGTGIYGASMAIASRVYEKYDSAYAVKLLSSAKHAFNYLKKTPNPIYRVDAGQESGSGPYNKNTDIDNRIWLAAELFKTTGDKSYEKYLQTVSDQFTAVPTVFSWENTLSFGQFAYLTNKKADPALQAKVKTAFLTYADNVLAAIQSDGYKCSLADNEYVWGSTKNVVGKGDILLMANQIEPNEKYVEGALEQIHYLFGRNANDKSYMLGEGSNPPQYPHDRIHESTGAYVPGLVVGGPNDISGGDPTQTKMLTDNKVAPAKAYIDTLMSWSTNEYAIDYAGPAAYALAYLSKPDSKLTANDIKLTREFKPFSATNK